MPFLNSCTLTCASTGSTKAAVTQSLNIMAELPQLFGKFELKAKKAAQNMAKEGEKGQWGPKDK